MKRSPLRVAVPYLALLGATFAFIALKLTLWSGPAIVMTTVGPELEIDSTFLGEYHLGLDRIRITTETSAAPVLDARDPGGRFPNIFRLRAGQNEIANESRRIPFALRPGEGYVLMVCGNNGWGRSGCRSRRFTLPAS